MGAPQDVARQFYADYVAQFAAAQKSGQPDMARLQFIKAHRQALEPGLYADLLKVLEPWADFQQGKGPMPGLVNEFDVLTGSAGDVLKDLKVGAPTDRGVPVSFASTSMRGSPMQLKLWVVVRQGQIADVQYGAGSSLRQALQDELRARAQQP